MSEKKLNKFEKTKLLSARALELAEGDSAKVKFKTKGPKLGRDYVAVAKKEFEEDKLELEIYYNK